MQRNYIFFAGRRIAWLNPSGSINYYFADAIGSTRAVTNATGTKCFDADYYPYGQENDYDTSCSPTYKFTGYEYDSETGNYYAYARYYNPRLGRFMSPDPLAGAVGNPQSLNRYAYVLNNPETLIDPLGLRCIHNSQGLAIGDDGTSPHCGGNQSVQVTSTPDCYMPEMSGTGSLEQAPCWLVFMTGKDYAWGGKPGGMGDGWFGPGIPGGGGTGGNTDSTPQSQSRLVCAAKTADKYSIAGAVGTIGKTGFWANVFNGVAGNTFSGLTLAFSGNGNKHRFATSVVNAPPPVGFAATANAINTVTTPTPILDLGLGAESAGEAAATFTGEALGGIVTGLKLGYDALSFAGAYLACSQ